MDGGQKGPARASSIHNPSKDFSGYTKIINFLTAGLDEGRRDPYDLRHRRKRAQESIRQRQNCLP